MHPRHTTRPSPFHPFVIVISTCLLVWGVGGGEGREYDDETSKELGDDKQALRASRQQRRPDTA